MGNRANSYEMKFVGLHASVQRISVFLKCYKAIVSAQIRLTLVVPKFKSFEQNNKNNIVYIHKNKYPNYSPVSSILKDLFGQQLNSHLMTMEWDSVVNKESINQKKTKPTLNHMVTFHFQCSWTGQKHFLKLCDRLCFYLFTAKHIQNINTPPCKHSRLFTAEICMTRPLEENGSSLRDLAKIDPLDVRAHSGGTKRA